MKLTALSVQDFRNYPQAKWEFNADQVVFCGANGKGKTNVLEAISLLSVGKSWREQNATDLIYEDAPQDGFSAHVKGQTNKNDILEVFIQPKKRQFIKNEKPTTRSRFFGQLPSLLFCPEFIYLFSGPKANRTQFFDRFLIQVSPNYRENLLKASKAHKHKTRILRQSELFQSGVSDQLKPWNEILCQTMPALHKEKLQLIKALTDSLQQELNEISQKQEPVSLQIELSEKVEYDYETLKKWLAANENREIAAQKNFIAPGRDDWQFHLRGRPLNATASRGEERSVLLALLAAQKELLTEITGTSPILLLDDVFSELDDTRQRHLEHLCAGSQVFFSTTHREHFNGFSGKIQVFEL